MLPDLPQVRPARGSLQAQRALAAQDAASFSVEERTPLDWLAVWQQLADSLRFYALDGQESGRWQALLPAREHWPALAAWLEHGSALPPALQARVAEPDLALLLAFLRLQRHPRAAFAALTERHRQDYYRRRLSLRPRRGQPDEADLLLSLNPAATPLTLPAGSLFDGGQDSDGQPRHYASLESLPLSAANLVRVLSLGQNKDGLLLRRCLDTAAGLDWDGNGNAIFGEAQLHDEQREHYHQPGFELRSPLLNLAAGQRRIRLLLNRDNAEPLLAILRALKQDSETPAATFNRHWQAAASTADARLALPPASLQWAPDGDAAANLVALAIEWQLDASAAALGAPAGQQPWLSLQLRRDAAQASLPRWQILRWSALQLDVSVDGLNVAIARNSRGVVNTTQAFDAFPGAIANGHRLTFAHPECWQKPLTELRLAPQWEGKPDDLAAYYASYYQALFVPEQPPKTTPDSSPTGTPASVPAPPRWPQAAVTLAQSATSPYRLTRAWRSDQPASSDGRLPILDNRDDTLCFRLELARPWQPLASADKLPGDPQAWPDWFALAYHGDPLGQAEEARVRDTLNGRYSRAMLRWSVDKFYYDANGNKQTEPPQQPFIPAPYTPRLASLSLGYSSRVALGSQLALRQYHPIGSLPAAQQGNSGQQALFPVAHEYAAANMLYLGIARLATPCVLTLRPDILLQNADTPRQSPQWKVLSPGGWQVLQTRKQGQGEDAAAVLSDQSNGMNNSGIIRLRLPALWQDGDGLSWLAVQLPPEAPDSAPPAYARLQRLDLHAVRVRYHGDSDRHLASPLPAASIGAPLPQHPAIAEVRQPAASQNGHPGEDDAQFAIRAAERLAHRGRALNALDAERLVLDAFPRLVLVRACRDGGDDGQPVGIRLVAVPQPDSPTLLQPRPDRKLQADIQRYLAPLLPPDVPLMVVAPQYREFRLHCHLVLHADVDAGSALEAINAALLQFLSPWRSRAVPGQSLYLSEISHFLAAHSAIRAVVALGSQYLAADGRWIDNPKPWLDTGRLLLGNERSTTFSLPPADLLVPVLRHVFQQLGDADALYQGIGVMEIGFDFLLPYASQLFTPAPLGQSRLGQDLAPTRA